MSPLSKLCEQAAEKGRDVPNVMKELLLHLEQRIAALEDHASTEMPPPAKVEKVAPTAPALGDD